MMEKPVILIADDEELVRFTLSSMLQELHLPLTIIEASSGAEMVSLLKNEKPDIALVDIRMPGMDGLQAIEEGKTICPDTSWIILTGHSEFEYAKKALELQVLEYLLKPVSADELERVVEASLSQARLRRKREMIMGEHYLQAVLDERADVDDEYYLHHLEKAVSFDIYLLPGSNRITLPDNKEMQPIRLLLPGGTMAYLLSGKERNGGKKVLLNLLKQQTLLFPLLYRDNYSDIRNIPHYLKHLESCLPSLLLLEFLNVYPAAALEQKHQEYHSRIITSFLSSLSQILESITNNSETFFQEMLTLKETILPDVRKRLTHDEINLLLRNISRHLTSIVPNNIDINSLVRHSLTGSSPLDSIPDLLSAFYRNRAAQVHQPQSIKSLVEKAELAGRRDFHLPIGVAQVAEELGVTPNYLSSQFKQEKGVGFNQFLTELRMDKARQLLLTSSFSIKEIAESIGYTGSRHFARIFKERFSLSPSAFLETYRRK